MGATTEDLSNLQRHMTHSKQQQEHIYDVRSSVKAAAASFAAIENRMKAATASAVSSGFLPVMADTIHNPDCLSDEVNAIDARHTLVCSQISNAYLFFGM